jgi:hypothetical protein
MQHLLAAANGCTAWFGVPAMKPDSPPDTQAGKKDSADPKISD